MSFLYPIALIGAPIGTALLLFVYRRSASGEPTEIPTLFLLHQFVTEASTPRKFIPPLRFFFELLLLLLITLASAGLSLEGYGHRTILVIDNSFQTAARLSTSSRVFDEVIERARESLRTNLSKDAILVMVTAPKLHAITEGFVSSSSAASALSSLGPVYASGELETRLASLVQREDVNRVVVASPNPIESGTITRERLQLLTVGSPALQNIAIEKMWQEDDKTVAVQVRSFSSEIATVVVSLSGVSASGQLKKISEQKAQLDPEGTVDVLLPARSEGAVGYRAKIEAPSIGPRNALAEDDEAWLSASRSSSTIGVVSYLPVQELNLGRVLGASLESIPISQIDESPERIRGWIFHRTAPTRPKGKPSLFILPPAESAIIRSTPFTQPWQVAVWDSASPLFRYLSPDNLRGIGGESLEATGQFAPLMRSEQGVLVAEGFHYDTHSVVLGFETLPFLGKENPPLSILLLNAIHHLFPDASSSGFPTYAPLIEEKYKHARYLASSPPLSPEGQTFEAAMPGLIVLDNPNTPISAQSVAFFDEGESNLLGRKPIKVAFSNEKGEAEQSVTSTMLHPFLSVLLILVGLDGFASLLRFRNLRRKPA